MITKTKKIAQCLIFTVVCLLATISSNAQMKFGASGGLGLPMGTFGVGTGMGFGGGVDGFYMLNDNMGLGLNVGFYTFKNTTLSTLLGAGYEIGTNIIPIAASFEYYFGTEGFKPYAGLDLGMYMISNTFGDKWPAATKDNSPSASKIGFAPVGGFAYGLSDNLDVFANVKYNYIMTDVLSTTFVGIGVGVNYILK